MVGRPTVPRRAAARFAKNLAFAKLRLGAPVAQWIEQRPSKPSVAGSIPAGGTIPAHRSFDRHSPVSSRECASAGLRPVDSPCCRATPSGRVPALSLARFRPSKDRRRDVPVRLAELEFLATLLCYNVEDLDHKTVPADSPRRSFSEALKSEDHDLDVRSALAFLYAFIHALANAFEWRECSWCPWTTFPF